MTSTTRLAHPARNPWTIREPGPVASAISDGAILREMRGVLRQHISAALLECSALSRDLTLLDADTVMTALRAEFDPGTAIDDAFSDAFFAAEGVVRDAGGDALFLAAAE